MKHHTNHRSEHRDLEQAAKWTLRRAEGESLEDDAAFRAWRDQDPGNPQVLEALERTLEDVDRFAGTPDMLRLRRDALAAAQRSHVLRRVRSMFKSRLGLAAGVAFICVMLGGVIAVHLRPQPHTLQTAVGERRSFLLADGSALSLDAATEVTVDYSTARRRLGLRSGRAKFNVARDPLRPFFVEAGGKVIVATGTSFSVELIESQVRVVLYEGHVEVLPVTSAKDEPRVKPQPARLRPGQELVASAADVAGVMRTTPIDTERSLAWESGDLTFADDPLALAVERVNRYSGRRVIVGDSDAAAVRISGIFHAGDTQAFIDGVTALFPVRAVQSEGVTTLLFEVKSER